MDGIKLVNVSKFYTVEKENMKVLDGINLIIPENKITVILGRSGCGKTTLLRLVAGLENFDKGDIIGANSIRKAYVFQEDRLMPWLNVKKNITFGIHNKDIDQVKNIVSTFRQGVLHKATKSKFKTSKNSRKFLLLYKTEPLFNS